MVAQVILNSSGLMVTQKLEDLGFINVLSVDAQELRTWQKRLTLKSLLLDAQNADHGSL